MHVHVGSDDSVKVETYIVRASANPALLVSEVSIPSGLSIE